MPNYLLSYSDHRVVVRNYEGFITTYEEPLDYSPHDPSRCAYCRSKRPEAGQTGISGLLQGESKTIKPEHFDLLHSRGGTVHRLRPAETKRLEDGKDKTTSH